MKEADQKVFKIGKRIVSGVKILDIMRFIVGRFTSFSPEIEFLPRHFLCRCLHVSTLKKSYFDSKMV